MKKIIYVIPALFLSCAGMNLPGQSWVDRACDIYPRAYTYVNTFVIPNLDGTTGLAAKLALELANTQIVKYCERKANGLDVSKIEIASSMAKGSRALAELIEINEKQIANPPQQKTIQGLVIAEPEKPVSNIDPKDLVSELRKIESQATMEMSK
jgi:hypothetical protein